MNTATDFILNVVARKSDEMLEPYERKRSRTVLRRERGSNSSDLVDYSNIEQAIEACTNKRISNRIADGMHDLDEGLAIIREERRVMQELLKKAMFLT